MGCRCWCRPRQHHMTACRLMQRNIVVSQIRLSQRQTGPYLHSSSLTISKRPAKQEIANTPSANVHQVLQANALDAFRGYGSNSELRSTSRLTTRTNKYVQLEYCCCSALCACERKCSRTRAKPSCIMNTRYPDVNRKEVLISAIQPKVFVSTTEDTAS